MPGRSDRSGDAPVRSYGKGSFARAEVADAR
jgi:hypothetical protein